MGITNNGSLKITMTQDMVSIINNNELSVSTQLLIRHSNI